jgi:hypothetical protein
MKLFAGLTIFALGLTSIVQLQAVCKMCEEIREYNAEHHKNYEYYEDYLKDGDHASGSDLKDAPAPIKAAESKKAE